MPAAIRDELRTQRWASVVAYGAVYGGPAARRAFRVAEKSLERWRATARRDAAFRELVERKRAEYETARVGAPRSAPAHPDAAADLIRAVRASVASVVEALGLPPVLSVARPRHLTGAIGPDFVFTHAAPSLHTACVVLPRVDAGQVEVEQRVVGRVFWLIENALFAGPDDGRLSELEGARLVCRVAPAEMRPVVLADYPPSPIFRLALRRVGAEVFDVGACLRRPQNVLASEGAEAAA